jgi:hypothetical protein
MYVREHRGEGGKDWGYVLDRSQARNLTPRMAAIYLGENVPGRYSWRY